jgi:ubiquinone biosynthesis protein
VKEWIRGELGPEALAAEAIRRQGETIRMIPDIIRRLDEQLPRKGGAPEPPPLPKVELLWERKAKRSSGGWLRTVATALVAGALGAAAMWMWG